MSTFLHIGGRSVATTEIVDFFNRCSSSPRTAVVKVDEPYLEKYAVAQSKALAKLEPSKLPQKPLSQDAEMLSSGVIMTVPLCRTAIATLLVQLLDNELSDVVVSVERINRLVSLVNDHSALAELCTKDGPMSADDATFNRCVLAHLGLNPDSEEDPLERVQANTILGSFSVDVTSSLLFSTFLPALTLGAKLGTATLLEIAKYPFTSIAQRAKVGSPAIAAIAKELQTLGHESKLGKRASTQPEAECALVTIMQSLAALETGGAAVHAEVVALCKRPLSPANLALMSPVDDLTTFVLPSLSNARRLVAALATLTSAMTCNDALDQEEAGPESLVASFAMAVTVFPGILSKLLDAALAAHQVNIVADKAAKKARFTGVQYASAVKEFIKLLIVEPDHSVSPEATNKVSEVRHLLNSVMGWHQMRDELSDFLVTKSGGKKPKTAKGCIDVSPTQMLIREAIMRRIKDTFQQYGAVQIDTPVFELMETLMGKYGEDSKLIYQLQDQGGEQLALRYDLTVPFARYVASNAIDSIRRFHIGKVYRRDEPQMMKGRFREFYQCDIDIAGGSHDAMVPETEALSAWIRLLQIFEGVLGPFKVHISHRVILDAMMNYCGVEESKTRAISSAIDKLDKEAWADVRSEMVDMKGLSPEVADKIKDYVEVSCPLKDVAAVLESFDMIKNDYKGCTHAVDELALLAKYLEASGVVDYVTFDFSLARGLDYYTGVIYEARLCGANAGSIGAGGRYDKLVGMFSNKSVPAVGVSLGIERIFRLVEQQLGLLSADSRGAKKEMKIAKMNGCPTQVFVASDCKDMADRIKLAMELRNVGIITEYHSKMKGQQFKIQRDKEIALTAYINDELIEEDSVEIRQLDAESGQHTKTVVTRSEAPARIATLVGSNDEGLASILREMGLKF